MLSIADDIAQAVLKQYDCLPPKRKPSTRSNGIAEWVPLSGIVIERDGNLTCVALATGMKCLPLTRLASANGVGIHDWHAEVLAMRALNRYLLDECQRILTGGGESEVVRRCLPYANDGLQYPFAVQEDVKFHMYCSEAPCGDASMELIMSLQEDSSAWDIPEAARAELPQGSLPGRAFFSQLGIVRRKPGRGDSPLSLSKSCSDKMALKQCTSLLGSLASMFIDPSNAYINTVILPESQYSVEGCKRSFSAEGRMSSIEGMEWSGGYHFKPFSIATTQQSFTYSKKSVEGRSATLAASNLAAVWTSSGVEETIHGGVLSGRKPFDIKGASLTSRRWMWMSASYIANMLGVSELITQLSSHTYQETKEGDLLRNRQIVKNQVRAESLKGWVRNSGDSDFNLANSLS